MESDTWRVRVFSLIHWVRLAILLAVTLMPGAFAIAGAITVTSPDHPETFTCGAMIWHRLYLDRTASELAARITFSNLPYAGDDEPRRDESFDFRFPSVQLDSAQPPFLRGAGTVN